MVSSEQKVSVLIPAYNEEKTIVDVITSVRRNNRVGEIIAVNDGSTDETADKVRQFRDVVLIDDEVNRGKGYAVYAGVRRARFPLIVMLDADLVGLAPWHIDKLITPLEQGEADLVLATIDLLREEERRLVESFFYKGPYEWLHLNYTILVTGQRAAYREDMLDVADIKNSRYGVDLLITDYYLARGKKIKKTFFEDVRHYRKGEKWEGEGRKLDLLTYRDILKTFGHLEARGSVLAQGFSPNKFERSDYDEKRLNHNSLFKEGR
jgi:glycosyltransferase involved in cell wall biosynthesis